MKRLIIIAALVFLSVSAYAISAPPDTQSLLRRDNQYEENLKYIASVDTAITPAKVFRWLSGLRGNALIGKPSNFEFQPIFRAEHEQEVIIGQFAYKF